MLQRPQLRLQQLKQRTQGVVAKVPMWENKGELASDFFFFNGYKLLSGLMHGPGSVNHFNTYNETRLKTVNYTFFKNQTIHSV